MRTTTPKFRHSLTDKQTRLLAFLFKFRFLTTDLLAELWDKDKSTIYERLRVLEEQGYVYKNYDSSYRIRQRPATYCLDAKGVTYLLNNEDRADKTTLRNFYRNKSQSEELIDGCLLKARIYLELQKQLPEGNVLTINELRSTKDVFPDPLPDFAFASKQPAYPYFFIDLWQAYTFNSLMRKRIAYYQEEADAVSHRYPYILFIAENKSVERRLLKHTQDNFSDAEFYMTTQDRLLDGESERIWIDGYESDEDEYVRIAIKKSNCQISTES